jgi:alkanesulfonate monooxygenase SsuD/methylene tetrahydromethanopterin reductase-like flavin-dependent oxidoreductase (luciferase family)
MDVGLILGDVSTDFAPRDHLAALLRQVEAAQRNGIRMIVMGHHYVYGDLRWLQPIPTLARLSAMLDPSVRIATMTVQAPLVHPIALAEELATLDILSDGRLTIGVGAGYREAEFIALGIPFSERFGRLTESLELMKRLWSEKVVSHHGRYYDIGEVLPHIQPTQQPHPPIWVGAMRDQGVRRSARLADAWPITPDLSLIEMIRLLAVYEDERLRVGKPLPKHPIRREMVPATTTSAAYERFEAMAKTRLMAYAQRSLASRDETEIASSFRAIAEREAFVGTPAEIVAKVESLARIAPVDQIIVRAQWPGMDSDAVVAYLDELGRDVIPALASIQSVDQVDRTLLDEQAGSAQR